jgi:hypothetical protein
MCFLTCRQAGGRNPKLFIVPAGLPGCAASPASSYQGVRNYPDIPVWIAAPYEVGGTMYRDVTTTT